MSNSLMYDPLSKRCHAGNVKSLATMTKEVEND